MTLQLLRRLVCRGSLFVLTACATSAALYAHEDHNHSSADEMRAAAGEFLDALRPELRQQASFEFDGPERLDWHFIPKDRHGVALREMSTPERRAAHKLLRISMSNQGYLKATTIMSLEETLRLVDKNRPDVEEFRDQEKYWFAVYGDPKGEGAWGWRVEGHHLSLNFSSADGHVLAAFPAFFGANPAEIRVGPRIGLRTLGEEEDLARELLASLNEEQRAEAVIAAESPRDILTMPGASIDLGEPAGIAMRELDEGQQKTLWSVVAVFARNLRAELADETFKEIKSAGADEIHFAWAGDPSPEAKCYFRIQGPTFLIEFDKTTPNHIHSVWQSMKKNFGLTALQRHYLDDDHDAPVVRHSPSKLSVDSNADETDHAKQDAVDQATDRVSLVD